MVKLPMTPEGEVPSVAGLVSIPCDLLVCVIGLKHAPLVGPNLSSLALCSGLISRSNFVMSCCHVALDKFMQNYRLVVTEGRLRMSSGALL